MCGRYANHVESMGKWTSLLGDWPKDAVLGYNISPTQTVPVFRDSKGIGMRWGLIPHWSPDGKSRYATFNARLESVESRPTYRSAWRRLNRCLIPALGYYEWRLEGGRKHPYFITPKEEGPIIFAGLWDEWQGDGASFLSCTILTRPSSAKLASLHDRMPVMLTVDSAERWLDSDVGSCKKILEHVMPPKLLVYRVGLAVNKPTNQGLDLIKPLDQGVSENIGSQPVA